MSEHVYAYGVLEQQELSLTVDGVEGATDLYTIDYKGLSVAVTDIDTNDVERTDENVQAHDDVLQTILDHDGGRTVVPMSFGMAFKNARTLKGVVRGARRAFRKALNDIEGTVELGVKLVSTGEEPADLAGIREALSAMAMNETDDDLFSDRLLLNRSYLVDREDRDEFGAVIDDIEAEYGDDVVVKYTGPFAPYSFVDIQIGAEGR
ncbi:GvpL/GvpF family gas vesicle protein [Halorubellus salinus]|uniref:GvpL/GvpF family gas vesicle protein n=1 Tax=Halorubellus salinus TaxID=755309 RepID=UPI001D07C6AE